jgi:hypothetical protein
MYGPIPPLSCIKSMILSVQNAYDISSTGGGLDDKMMINNNMMAKKCKRNVVKVN